MTKKKFLTPLAIAEFMKMPKIPKSAAKLQVANTVDMVNHPPHYNLHPSGVEAIVITEHFTFNVGNAIKYLWRAGLKSDKPIEDLRKAIWYIDREMTRLTSTTR